MTRNDQQLIAEAYSAVSFKQSLPNMSLKVLRENVYNLNTAELTETTEVINELFGGLRNVFSGVKNTAAAAGGAIKNAAVNTGRAVAAGARQVVVRLQICTRPVNSKLQQLNSKNKLKIQLIN